MKKIYYILILVAFTTTFSGCKKYLSLDPPSDLSGNNFWRNKNDVERYTNGLYELFRKAVYRSNMYAPPGNDEFPFFAWGGDMRGAPVKSNPEYSRTYIDILAANNIRTVVNNLPNGYGTLFNAKRFTQWDRFYRVIASANIAIDRIPGIDDPSMSENDKAKYVGEASFMRNLSYFFMVRLYGDVPYYTEPYFSGSLVRTPMVEVLKNLTADLEAKKQGLPWTYENNTQLAVRAMRGSAIVLQMHINMWLAGFDPDNASAYYATVDKLGDELQSGGAAAYELLPLSRSKEIFKGRTREGLFEIPQNVNYGESFGWSAFSDNVLYAPYKTRFIQFSYLSYLPGFMEELYPQGEADGRKAAWFDQTQMYSGGGKFLMLKFANVFANENAEDFNPDDNQTVFRLPDVYLLQAEALAGMGNWDKAKTMLNKVRQRAGAPDITSTGNDLIDDIFFERCREFMGEGQYWYDAVRTKRIIDVTYKYGYHCTVDQFKAGAWTWPIDPNARINNPGITLNNYWQ